MFYPKRVALTALLVVFHCPAQTPAELLQKGIYEQETAGNLDAALQVYRQVTVSAPSQSSVAAQAQLRIAEVLLQKGDLNGAAIEFNILASRYPEQQALIARMAGRMHGVVIQPTGVVRDGRYRNKRTGLEFPLPSPWRTLMDGPSSDNGDMVTVSDGSPLTFGVWMRPEVSTPAEIPDKLRASIPAKVKMNADVTGFAFRPESIQPHTVAGQQALTAVAEFVDGGQKRATIYTWIYTAKTHVVFIAGDVPVPDVAAVQSRLDQFVATVVVP